MDHVEVLLNDEATFDMALKASLAEAGDMAIITKDVGTVEGNPIVMFSFSAIELDADRKPQKVHPVQYVMTVKNFAMLASALKGRYPQFFS